MYIESESLHLFLDKNAYRKVLSSHLNIGYRPNMCRLSANMLPSSLDAKLSENKNFKMKTCLSFSYPSLASQYKHGHIGSDHTDNNIQLL